MLSHHTPEKNGGSPLHEILSLPTFSTSPPPLPAIKDAFEREVAEQVPIIKDADKVALQIPEIAPEDRAQTFDSFVFSSLKGPILEASVIATMLVHPVDTRSRGIYFELKENFAAFVQAIPTYSLIPSYATPDIVEHKYTPVVLQRVEGGLEYLSFLLEKERILSGDWSFALEHFIHSSTVDPLKALLSKVGAFDGTNFTSLSRRQQLILLRPTTSSGVDEVEIIAARKAAQELTRSTREFINEYGVSLAYLRSGLFTCIRVMEDAVGNGTISSEHRLLKQLTATLKELDSFEKAAFRKNPSPSSIIQDADAAARFFRTLNDLKGVIQKSLTQYGTVPSE